MNIQQAIKAVTEKTDLSRKDMQAVMTQIMIGGATDAQIGGFLIGLRMKGETVDEITAAAAVMRDLAIKVNTNTDHLVDTCGTGGDASGSFNISTASAIVAAAAGAKVAKHGNRAVSSQSGSADVLEAAGVNLDITPDQVAGCIDTVGLGFLFAQKHHSAMRFAITARKEMAVRTIFNVLGPLTNPASAPNQVMGVFAKELVTPITQVLKELGSRHVMVVHSADGMDEISVSGATTVAELKDGKIKTYSIKPEDFGLKTAVLEELKVASSYESLAMIQAVLANKDSSAKDIVCLNAGAAIYVAGLAKTHQQGVELASQAISSGKAQATLDKLIKASHSFSASKP